MEQQNGPISFENIVPIGFELHGQFKMLTLICKDLNDFGSGYGLRELRNIAYGPIGRFGHE